MAAPLPAETAEIRLQALRRKPRGDRRLALMPRVDDMAAAAAALAALAAAGYRVTGLPAGAADLRAQLAAADGEAIMLGDYDAFCATLPAALRDAVAARWGAAERDPLYRPGRVDCGRFVVPALHLGAVAVIEAAPDDATVPPRHHELARAAWIAVGFRADAAIAWTPLGVALALPVLVPTTADAPDTVELLAALDGDAAALRRWHAT
ncbi:MAG: cobaltochelatase subunit CobN [Alphaproteobacteria bacterium]|nr:cobaltochelatase subunit CobN [Alphaproteobacteria bacterium]